MDTSRVSAKRQRNDFSNKAMCKSAAATSAAATLTASATLFSAAASTTLKAASQTGGKQRIEVTPPMGDYINFDVDTTYVIAFLVRNRTGSIRTLRFTPPSKSTVFRLMNPASVRLASGLDHTLEVEFSTHTPDDYDDKFVIRCNGGVEVTVPLRARQVPELGFPRTVSFGRVEQSPLVTTKPIHFTNRGRRDVVVKLLLEGLAEMFKGLTLTSKTFTVKAFGEASTVLELAQLPPGSYACDIAIETDGTRIDRKIHVSVDVVDCHCALIDRQTGEDVVSIEFNEGYAGVPQRLQFTVMNGSEQDVSFAVQLSNDPMDSNYPPFRFLPEQGRLKAKERKPITVMFSPPPIAPRTGWSGKATEKKSDQNHFEAIYALLFVEMEQTQNFRVTGSSCETLVHVSSSTVSFGECFVDTMQVQELVISNLVNHLPMRFATSRVPHITVEPAEGEVVPGGKLTVQIRIYPRRLGSYKEKVVFTFNETITRNVMVLATSLSVPKKGSLQSYRGTAKGRSLSTTRSGSLTYTKTSSMLRNEIPTEEDMGMIPSEGLEPPKLPHHIPQHLITAEDAINQRHRVSHVAPATFDVKTLIRRRYHELPASAHERQDCRRDLPPMELLRVLLPLKVVDFQHVTVGAKVVQSFYVFNGTSRSILASMPDEGDAPVSFEPLSQVIPPQRMAQFDVKLCCHSVQFFQQVCHIGINQHHHMRFTIQGEVVPVEVGLSHKEFSLHFSGLTDDPVVSSHLTMSNHGNSEAAYEWRVPSTSPFTISPMMGIIPPLTQMTASVTFHPVPGAPPQVSDVAVLHVERAVEDKLLPLTGIVSTTRCGWGAVASTSPSITLSTPKDATATPILSLARIAAGVATTVVVPLVNRSNISAHYSIDGLPPWLSVQPSHGRVRGGEAEELTVTTQHPIAEPVEFVIQCWIIGMRKPLRLGVEATVVAPPLALISPDKVQGEVRLSFGVVYVGCPQRQSCVMRNAGDMAGAVVMDLSGCPDFSYVHKSVDGVVDSVEDSKSDVGHAQRSRGLSRARSILALTGDIGDAAPLLPTTYTVVVPPMSDFTIVFSYSPSRPATGTSYSVKWRQVGADDLHPLPPLWLNASARDPPVVLSPTQMKFPPVVVGGVLTPFSLRVQCRKEVANGDGDEGIPWRLTSGQMTGEGVTGRLLVEPSQGVLKAGEAQNVSVSYVAARSGVFSSAVSLFVEGGEGVTAPCRVCRITASATDPRVVCSQQSVIFPTIPLSVAIETTIYLLNDGFDSVHVDYHGACDPPLSISFPKGHTMLAPPLDRIPVTFTFSSAKPISINSSICLHTERGSTIEVQVSGTAINSILAIENFLSDMANSVFIGKTDGHPYELRSEKDEPLRFALNPPPLFSEEAALANYGLTGFEMVDLGSNVALQEKDLGFVGAWMDAYLLRSTAPDLLEALQTTHGGLIFDLLEVLLGKRLLRLEADHHRRGQHQQLSTKRNSRVGPSAKTVTIVNEAATNAAGGDAATASTKGVRNLQTLLHFLRSHGACLSSVRLAHLLPLVEYLDYSAKAMPPGSGGTAAGPIEGLGVSDTTEDDLSPEDCHTLQETYHMRSMDAWLTVIHEVIRLFYVSSVRNTSAASPILRDSLAAPSLRRLLSASNVYSEEESLILQWISVSVTAYNTDDPATRGSDSQTFVALTPQRFEHLRDARALLATVFVHVPILAAFLTQEGQTVVADPISFTDHEANAIVLLFALRTLGVPSLPSPADFMNFRSLQMVMLTTYLYRYLPRFLEKAPVPFTGKLLTKLTNNINVENKSAVPHEYRIILLRNSLFETPVRELTVSPHSSAAATFSVVPRHPRPVQCDCLFVDVSPQVVPSERVPLSFFLQALPNMEPLLTLHLETALYDSLTSEVMVENPFSRDCVAGLRVSQMYIGDDEDGASTYPEAAYWRSAHRSPFLVASDVLPLRKGELTRLPFFFTAMSRGLYRMVLTFREEREGEFTYQVDVRCRWPRVVDAGVDFRVEQGETSTPSAPLRCINTALERCMKAYEDRIRSLHRTDFARLFSGRTYTVQFLNDAMEGPNPFFTLVQPEQQQQLPEQMQPVQQYVNPSDTTAGNLDFVFHPVDIGTYSARILLTSDVDVRILTINGECVPKGDARILQFACPARQSIQQSISLHNTTAVDWLLTATFEGSSSFSGPRDLRILPGKAKDYQLKYSPAWLTPDGEEEKATLFLWNEATGQKHQYTLRGTAAAPLSEDVIQVSCKARERQTVQLVVPNICSSDTTYFVQTNLPCCEGEPSLVIQRASVGRYTLAIVPTVGGTMRGKVTCTTPQGRYVWYVVELQVAPPDKEGTVELRTDVRTSMVAQITISNPLEDPLSFNVRRYGAGLYGTNSIRLEPHAEGTYSLMFVPTHVGQATGRLSFISDVVGELWYELKMQVEDAAPEELSFGITPLGQPCPRSIKLPNITSTDCALTVQSTNPQNFSAGASRVVVLPANSESTVELLYTPTAIDVEQTGTITLSHPDLGTWRYTCKGSGTAPLPAEPLSCICQVGSTTTLNIPFKNTLGVATGVEVQLTDTAAFTVKTAPTSAIPAGASATVVVSFHSTLVRDYEAVLKVRPVVGKSMPSFNVAWCFPIQGHCEYRQMLKPLRLHCQARKQWTENIYLNAPGVSPELVRGATLTLELDSRQSYAAAVQSSLEYKLTDPSPYPDGFEVQLSFAPLRPLVATGELLIRAATGGVWRYRVLLESTPAPVDDTIILSSNYSEVVTVAFDIYNVFSYKSKYFAYFTSDSSRDLTVRPAHGVLLPFIAGQRRAAAATTLQITLCPSTRIPQVEGTLVVDTDDMQWSFRVVGRLGKQPHV